jgi:hypothetical protein
MGELSVKVGEAGKHFRVLAKRMDDLTREVAELEGEEEADRIIELEEELKDQEDEVESANDRAKRIDEMIEDLRDVGRGVKDLDEVIKKWDVEDAE